MDGTAPGCCTRVSGGLRPRLLALKGFAAIPYLLSTRRRARGDAEGLRGDRVLTRVTDSMATAPASRHDTILDASRQRARRRGRGEVDALPRSCAQATRCDAG